MINYVHFDYYPKKYPQYMSLPDSAVDIGPVAVLDYRYQFIHMVAEESRQRMAEMKKKALTNPEKNKELLALFAKFEREHQKSV